MSEKKSRAGLYALGGKLIGLLAKFAKGAKFLKFGFAAATLAGYAAVYTWKFAILIMVAIGWHESGHVWAMKKMGIKTKGFYFIPFLGGAAIQEEQHKTYGQNVFVAIMGPIWGALLAIVCAIAFWWTHHPMFAAAAAWMAFLNVFNLLPIMPLDGGQIFRSIFFSIHKNIGLAFMGISSILAVILLFKLKIGLFALILLIGLIDLVVEVWNRKLLRRYKNGEIKKWELPLSLFDDKMQVKAYPTELNRKQLFGTVIGYAVLVIGLLWLNKSMAHVPGAELAANFLE